MPSGESLIRQMLFGQKYFQTKFGKRCDTSWLPDSFGLTGALPQLIRGAGMFAILNFLALSNLLPRNEVLFHPKNIMVHR